jgi:sec-independent protein translocase protein TatA
MDIGPTELLIILVIVAVLFGGGRIAKIGGELGSAVANFRRGLQNPQDWNENPSQSDQPAPGKETL